MSAQTCKVEQEKDCPFQESLKRIEMGITEVKSDVKDIHTHIFIGNGKPSIMIRLDRTEQEHKRKQKVFNWFAGITSAVIVGLVLLVFTTVLDSRKPLAIDATAAKVAREEIIKMLKTEMQERGERK